MSKPTGDPACRREAGSGSWGTTYARVVPGALVAFLIVLLPAKTEASINQMPKLVPQAAEATTGGGNSATGSHSIARKSGPTGRWIVAGIPGKQTHDRAVNAGGRAISRRLGIYALSEKSARGLIESLRQVGTYRFSEPDIPAISSMPTSGSTVDADNEEWWLAQIKRPNTLPRVPLNSPTMALVERSLDPKHPDLAGLEARDRLLDPFSLGDQTDARGTSMAALAASLGGRNDGKVTGVWPGMRIRLARSQDTCESKARAVIRAAGNRRNRVLAMGYTFPGNRCFAHYMATEYAVSRGLVPVAEVGAESSAGSPRPASDPHVLAVTSADREGAIPGWTGRGSWVDMAAPGDDLRVAWIEEGTQEQMVRGWATRSGTAYSATIVGAAAAWLMQARPSLKARQTIRLITNTASPIGRAGRSTASGHGLLNLTRALRERAPIDDPLEPNDDIVWVRANSPIGNGAGKVYWRSGQRERKMTATLSRAKDPADVYRVRIAPGGKARIAVSQFAGRTSLKVVDFAASSIGKLKPNQLVASSDRPPGKRADAVDVRNRSRLHLTAFVVIEVSPKQAGENSAYRLSVKSEP